MRRVFPLDSVKTEEKLLFALRSSLSTCATVESVPSVDGGLYTFARLGQDWQVVKN
jgi:hypothetical protein